MRKNLAVILPQRGRSTPDLDRRLTEVYRRDDRLEIPRDRMMDGPNNLVMRNLWVVQHILVGINLGDPEPIRLETLQPVLGILFFNLRRDQRDVYKRQVRVYSFAFCAAANTSSRVPPSAAFAAAHLYI